MKPKIALLISGRATRYDVCLIPFLLNNSNKYEIHVFMSINDENSDCEYFIKMKTLLKDWLKSCIIKKYIIPEDFANTFNDKESISKRLNNIQCNLQKINGKFLPYNCLSMYYNDNLNFKNACNYADENNFEYDCYMKYRSDIMNSVIPEIVVSDEVKIYCVEPICNFISNGLFNFPIVSDAFSWGNRKSMSIYCNTYDYVLGLNKEYNGKYFIAFECSLTDNIYENKVPIYYTKIHYSLDINRRMFDDIENDSRKPMHGQTVFLKITDKESTEIINAVKQE